MLLLSSRHLPEVPNWAYELKLDGYRAIAVKSNGKTHLRSRNNKGFDNHYRAITDALAAMLDETVVDGDVVAVDENRRPSFNLLQSSGSGKAPLLDYVFDVLVLDGPT